MAEKRGQLERMIYDFPTEAVLEVCIKGNWYRTTSREFRSFDGPRRFTKPSRQPGLGMRDINEIEFITVEYNGPVYMFGSNIRVEPLGTEKVTMSPILKESLNTSGSRR